MRNACHGIAGLILCLSLFLLFIPLVLFAQSQTKEELVITTYYPVPYGDYQELRVKRLALGDTYYSTAQYCWDDPSKCTNLIDGNTDLVVEGNVGIGTASPDAKLTVAGNTHITGTLTVDSNVLFKSNLNVAGVIDAANWPTINYADCAFKQPGKPTGPHVTYCPEGYINVGSHTDGNDWIPEGIICCRMEGVKTKNWNARQYWGYLD